MIKKLKIKLILNNIFLIGIVITIIFSALCLITYVLEEYKLNSILEENIDFFASESSTPPEKPQESTDRVYSILCTVLIDKNEQIFAVSGNTMPQEIMTQAIDYSLNSETERGNIYSLNVSFL